MKFSKEFMKPFNGRVQEGFKEMIEKGLNPQNRDDKPLSDKEQRVYYVYACYVDDELRYIGMGKGARYKHCISGKSSCSELNRDFHAGKVLRVEKIETKLTQREAANLEADLIDEYMEEGLYNKLVYPSVASQPLISKVVGVTVKQKQDPKELMKQIAKVSPNITEYDFENLKYWLEKCGLHMCIAEVGTVNTLVLDKQFVRAFDYLHTGCVNYPNCDLVGCGKK